MSIAVLADAQFGIARVLRPYPGAVSATAGPISYEGLAGFRPIMWSEGGIALDDLAGKPGYDPGLLRGLPVPMGSRILLWLPEIGSYFLPPPVDKRGAEYEWVITWRLRNTFDYRVARRPYHFPKASAGAADSGASPSERVILPCLSQSIIVNDVSVTDLVATQSIVFETYRPGFDNKFVQATLPLTPVASVEGCYQQGVFNPVTYALAKYPTFKPVELQCLGDEMLIGVRQVKGTGDGGGVWDFNVFDKPMRELLESSPDLGVYVMTGSAP